ADPVSSGLVGSLARPGGNVTGLSLQQTDAAGKRLQLLREVLPDFRRLAIMANVGYPAAVLDMNEVQVAARKLGLEVVDKLELRKAEDVAPAFDALKGGAQALYVCGDPLVDAVRARINILALGARLPTLYPNREYLQAGGLMSYGPSFSDLFLRAADYVDKILHGAKPADQVRASHQPNRRQGAPSDNPRVDPAARRRGDRMTTRRGFITLLGGAAAWPLAARAQQPAMPVVGYLDASSPVASASRAVIFRRGLAQAGYVGGGNGAVGDRRGEGQYDRLPGRAGGGVRRQGARVV